MGLLWLYALDTWMPAKILPGKKKVIFWNDAWWNRSPYLFMLKMVRIGRVHTGCALWRSASQRRLRTLKPPIVDILDVTLLAWTSDHDTTRDGVLVKTPQLIWIHLQGNILVAAYACNTHRDNPCGLRVGMGHGVNDIARTLHCCAHAPVQSAQNASLTPRDVIQLIGQQCEQDPNSLCPRWWLGLHTPVNVICLADGSWSLMALPVQ